MQVNPEIRLISIFSLHMNPGSLIQCINQFLLDFLIQIIIQRVDFHGLPEYLLEIVSDRRYRIGYDGKTGFFSPYISIYNLTGFIIHMHLKFLLFFTERCRLFTRRWRKRCRSKDFYHCRTTLFYRQFLIFLISSLHRPQLPANKITVQKKRAVISVIVVILRIGDRPIVPNSKLLPLINHMGSSPIDHRF